MDKSFLRYNGEKPVDFLCLKQPGSDTVDIYVMGVLKEYHRQGIGRQLFRRAAETAREAGCSFIQVKTVQMGRYAEYGRKITLMPCEDLLIAAGQMFS